ncbi:C-terminal binding protein [Haloparvum alkalitolerans]|uniref:C-terminal binding protein n=1 Tax=Haloparvum alkalitolerans TaxID=1042953 RepID=UPI003CE77B28
MRVVLTDRRFTDQEPYREAVEAAGGELVAVEAETEAEVVAACRDADVVVTFKAPISRAAIEAMGDCRLIMRNGAGFDNVDVAAASEHGIPVSNVPGYGNDDVASHAIALMHAAAHEIVHADRDVRESEGWGERRPINPMYGRTFGIVGFGRIGRAAVPMARGLDMDVIAYDPYVDDDVFEAFGVERVTFADLLDRAACVSIHAPLTAETRGLFSTPEFERMAADAVLVNTARGPIVDEAALVEAVEEGAIYAAGLDVFETEPPTDTPALACDRIVCSPHHGGMSPRANERCVAIGREEIVRALTGEHLRNVVNPEVFQRGEGLVNPERDAWSE